VITRTTLPQDDDLLLPAHLQTSPTTLDMLPGPQPWNSGITPQSYLDLFGDDHRGTNQLASRAEVSELRENLDEVAMVVARLEALLAGRGS
jgi:hypothetical protein